jgi:hypothetical protein
MYLSMNIYSGALMKRIILVFLLLTLSIAHASEPALPQIFFTYSWLYDGVVCAQNPVDSKWIDELESKMDHFDNVWKEKGSVFFKVIFDQTGRGFSRKELTATMSVCPKKPSYSNPLTLNMNIFLDSYMAPTRTGFVDNRFADLVFHELLHTFVVENLDDSPMITKYKEEIPVVRNHLHVMALQKFVYTKLGRDDLLTMLDRSYNFIGGAYARAWEIVQTEGYEVFLKELPSVAQETK